MISANTGDKSSMTVETGIEIKAQFIAVKKLWEDTT